MEGILRSVERQFMVQFEAQQQKIEAQQRRIETVELQQKKSFSFIAFLLVLIVLQSV